MPRSRSHKKRSSPKTPIDSPRYFEIGTKRKGRDGHMYQVVVSGVSGNNRWKRCVKSCSGRRRMIPLGPKLEGGAKRRSYSKKSCPRRSVSRKAYSYTRKNGTKVHVRASCVKSKGIRSRGKKPLYVIPKLKKGALTKFGYYIHESSDERHKALRKAIKEYGFSGLVKKLNAVRVLTKNTSPENSKKYKSDIIYLENNF